MLDIFYSSQFKKDYKRMKKQGKSVELLLDVVEILAGEGALGCTPGPARWWRAPVPPPGRLPGGCRPPASGQSATKYQDHALAGGYIGHRECHIQPDWLLI